MNNRLHILQHSLGLNQYGEGRRYRNHFCTGPDSTDFDDCRALVADGLMDERAGNALSGGDSIFHVTPKGIDYVALNSPQRPPEPRLTRSQKRYREYLRAESALSFAEWLDIGA